LATKPSYDDVAGKLKTAGEKGKARCLTASLRKKQAMKPGKCDILSKSECSGCKGLKDYACWYLETVELPPSSEADSSEKRWNLFIREQGSLSKDIEIGDPSA